jgi:hypothetical protein
MKQTTALNLPNVHSFIVMTFKLLASVSFKGATQYLIVQNLVNLINYGFKLYLNRI